VSNSDGLSGNDRYLDQVTANIVRAQQYLAEAQQRAADWPLCSSALARALEHAVCAVFIAWGEPYKAGWKIHRHFEERLTPYIDPSVVSFVTALWKLEGSDGSGFSDLMIAACRQIIDRIEQLAINPPPANWQPRPIPQPVRWDRLADDERSFLEEALRAAREACPEVRLLLFGSRAGGTAEPTSDYDLLFIFPTAFPDRDYGQSVGRVVSLATQQGIAVDTEAVNESQWSMPPQSRRPLIDRVKACHVEVLER
jgi:predicted nucleotidyltransferase